MPTALCARSNRNYRREISSGRLHNLQSLNMMIESIEFIGKDHNLTICDLLTSLMISANPNYLPLYGDSSITIVLFPRIPIPHQSPTPPLFQAHWLTRQKSTYPPTHDIAVQATNQVHYILCKQGISPRVNGKKKRNGDRMKVMKRRDVLWKNLTARCRW